MRDTERDGVILRARGLTKRFGGLVALDDVSVDVEEGQLLGLIGPNGSGKSTFFNLVCGTHRPTEGRIRFRDEDLTGLKPHRVASKGIVRAFQLPTVFPEFTVRESMAIAADLHIRSTLVDDFVPRRRARSTSEAAMERASEILSFVGMQDFADKFAGELSYGYRKTMGVAMALAAEPQLLLLDEPLAGLNPHRTKRMVRLIQEINGQGTTVILVEHNMSVMMGICKQIVVFNAGRKIAQGGPTEVREDPEVIRAYLGGGGSDAA